MKKKSRKGFQNEPTIALNISIHIHMSMKRTSQHELEKNKKAHKGGNGEQSQKIEREISEAQRMG